MRGLPTSPPFIWLGFLVVGTMSLVDGLIMVVFGAEAEQSTIQSQLGITWDELSRSSPVFAQYVNTLTMIIGLLLTGFSLFIIVVSVTGYKRGHKWAWYSMWNATAFYLIVTIIFFAKGDVFTSDAMSPEFMIAMLIGTLSFQLMGYAGFFGKPGQEGAGQTASSDSARDSPGR